VGGPAGAYHRALATASTDEAHWGAPDFLVFSEYQFMGESVRPADPLGPSDALPCSAGLLPGCAILPLDLHQQHVHGHTERGGEFVEDEDGGVTDAALDAADIGAVDAGLEGELLL